MNECKACISNDKNDDIFNKITTCKLQLGIFGDLDVELWLNKDPDDDELTYLSVDVSDINLGGNFDESILSAKINFCPWCGRKLVGDDDE